MTTAASTRQRPTAPRPTQPVTPALTAIVRNRDGTTVEIAESAAWMSHTAFMAYVWRCLAAGYRVELYR